MEYIYDQSHLSLQWNANQKRARPVQDEDEMDMHNNGNTKRPRTPVPYTNLIQETSPMAWEATMSQLAIKSPSPLSAEERRCETSGWRYEADAAQVSFEAADTNELASLPVMPDNINLHPDRVCIGMVRIIQTVPQCSSGNQAMRLLIDVLPSAPWHQI